MVAHRRSVKRPRLRVLLLLVGTLTFSLVSTTSYALYRTAMGPEQCCKSHCHHRMPKDAAQRCCRTHLTVIPAAMSKELSARDASAPAHVTCQTLPSLVLPAPVASSPVLQVVDERAQPGPSLFAQHVSLLI